MAHPEDTEGQGESLTDQLNSWIRGWIDNVHDHTIRPLLIAIRGLIMGTLAVIIGLAVVAMICIGLIRLFDVEVFSGRVWATDLLFGALFLLIGAILLRRIRPRKDLHAGR